MLLLRFYVKVRVWAHGEVQVDFELLKLIAQGLLRMKAYLVGCLRQFAQVTAKVGVFQSHFPSFEVASFFCEIHFLILAGECQVLRGKKSNVSTSSWSSMSQQSAYR